MPFLLQFVFEVDERGHPTLGVLVDPAVVQETDRNGVEVVQLLPADLVADDQVGFFENLEMLHHAEAREVGQLGFEVDKRPSVLLEETVEQ